MLNKCVFCDWVKENTKSILENQFFVCRFNNYPVSPGHVLIIPKRHIVNLSDLNVDEWNELKFFIKEVIELVEKTDLKKVYEEMSKNPIDSNSEWFCKKAINHPRINTKPDAYNYGVNDGKAAGRTVDHFHWHIIPRFDGDMDDPRGGVCYVIPEMGNYKIPR